VGAEVDGRFSPDYRPQRLSDDPDCARRLLELVPQVPTPVWGRDELRAGEMWNSNSTISWLIARSGLDAEAIQPPTGGPRSRLERRPGGRKAPADPRLSRVAGISLAHTRALPDIAEKGVET
jgi:hypothetical protein